MAVHAGRKFGQQQAIAGDRFLQCAVRTRIVHVHACTKHRDRAPAGIEGCLVRGAVDAASESADDRCTGARAGRRNRARDAETVAAGLSRADDRDGGRRRGKQLTAGVQHRRGIVQFQQSRWKLVVGAHHHARAAPLRGHQDLVGIVIRARALCGGFCGERALR